MLAVQNHERERKKTTYTHARTRTCTHTHTHTRVCAHPGVGVGSLISQMKIAFCTVVKIFHVILIIRKCTFMCLSYYNIHYKLQYRSSGSNSSILSSTTTKNIICIYILFLVVYIYAPFVFLFSKFMSVILCVQYFDCSSIGRSDCFSPDGILL